MAESKAAAKTKDSIWSPMFVALLLTNFFNSFGQATAGTVLPLFARDLGATTSVIGFVAGAFAITALAIRPFAGPAFDSFSKKRLLMASIGINCCSMILYSCATSIPIILGIRLLHGVGMGCAAPLALSLVSDTLPQTRINSGISIYMLSMSAAMLVGPAFGIWMSQAVGYTPTFMVTTASLGVSLALVTFLVKDSAIPPGGRPPYQLSLKRAFAVRAIGLSCVLMFFSMTFSCIGSFMAIYGNLRGVGEIGLYFTVQAACLFATRPIFGRISDRVGTTRVLLTSATCFALSFVLISQAHELWQFLGTAVVAACGFGVCNPLIQALIFKCVPQEARGSASNTSYTGIDIGSLVGPYLGGTIIETITPLVSDEVTAYSTMWLIMIIPMVLGVALYLALSKRIQYYIQTKDEVNHLS